MNESTSAPTRSVDLEVELDASAEAVWCALTDAEELQSWFPLEARVEPGVGGSMFISWGPGVEGEGAIEIWEPGHHLRVLEHSGTDDEGRPVRVAVDYHIEGRGGRSVLRVVHSGFSAGAEWDEYYDTTESGWRYFLWHLGFYLRRHRGVARQMAWARVPLTLPHGTVWKALLGADGLHLSNPDGSSVNEPAVGDACTIQLDGTHRDQGYVVVCEPGVHLAVTLQGLDHGVLFVELEPGGESWHLGLWLSVYGQTQERVEGLQGQVEALGQRLVGEPAGSS